MTGNELVDTEPGTSVPLVQIITPVYNEEKSLLLYEKAVSDSLISLKDYDFRVLFIDDGSEDESWLIIKDICRRNCRFEGLRLSRNYGSHIAISAGFNNVKGDVFAVLACDLQDPPTVILEFLEQWETGAKIVWGYRKTRMDDGWRVLSSSIFTSLLRRFAMPRGSKFTSGSFFLIDKEVAECYCSYSEQSPITFALIAWTGFDQSIVEYHRQERIAGKSGWTFGKMLKSIYDTFLGFSAVPIQFITVTGIVVSFIAFALLLYLFYLSLNETPVPGWTSTIFSMSFFFGLQFLMLSLLAEYLARIYKEVLGRPRFFISERTLMDPNRDINLNKKVL